MVKVNDKGTAVLLGGMAGAILMTLAMAIVFGLGTGATGGTLVLLIVSVAGASGWLVGYHSKLRKNTNAAYWKGYQEGLKKNTLIIENSECRYTFTVADYMKIE